MPVIINKPVLKKTLLIFFVTILFLRLLQVYKIWGNFGKKEGVEFELQILEINKNCWFSEQNFIFQLKDCFQYQIGSTLLIIGRAVGESDNNFWSPKRLEVESVMPIVNTITSLKSWIACLNQSIIGLKNALLERVIGYIPEPNFSLMVNMIFGKVAVLPPSLDHSFKVTGTQHVMAASGFNISVIGMLLNVFSRRFGRLQSLAIWWIGIFIYVFSTDLSITLFRAALMAIFKRMGSDIGQKTFHNLNLLIIVCALILFLDPYLLFDISFQLSATATLGIILFLPLIGITDPAAESTTVLSLKSFFKEAFQTTLAAQAFALPIILFHFGELSFLSVLVNTFLLWLTPIITIAGLLFILISPLLIVFSFFENLLRIIAFYVWLPSEIFIKSLEKFGQFENFLITGLDFSFISLLIWWGLVLLGFYLLKKRRDEKNKKFSTAYSFKFELAELDCT